MPLHIGRPSLRRSYRLTKTGLSAMKVRVEELYQTRVEQVERLRLLREQQSDGLTIEDSGLIQTLSTIQTLDSEISGALHVLKNATLLRHNPGKTKEVGLGSRVRLQAGRKQLEYTIVSSIEADPLNGKISDESPIGRELLGKKAADFVSITNTPGRRSMKFRVISFN